MTPLQKIELKRSEIRQELCKLGDLETRDDSQESRIRELTKELGNSESEYQAALAIHEAYLPEDAQGREFCRLESRAVSLEECWLAKLSMGEAINGATAEYQRELNLREDEIDLHLLRGTDQRKTGLIEHRADVPTGTPGGSTSTYLQTNPVAMRVFKPAIEMALGLTSQTVNSAEQAFPVLTGGTGAAMVAADALQESSAGSFSVDVLKPKESRARLTVRSRDMLVYPGLEATLRADMASSLDDLVSNQILNGSGTGAEVQGLQSAINDPTPETGSVANFGVFQRLPVNLVDGQYANSLQDIRSVIGKTTWILSQLAEKSSQSDLFVHDWLVMKTGGWTLSDRVEPANTQNKNQITYHSRARGLAESHALVYWRGVQIVRDNVSDSGRGWTHVVANLGWDFKILRDANFAKGSLKVLS